MQVSLPGQLPACTKTRSTHINDGLSDFQDRRSYPYSTDSESEIKEEDMDEDDEMGGLTPTRP